jgi:hypothetical protein
MYRVGKIIKTDLKDTGYVDVAWIYLAQDVDNRRPFFKTVTTFSVSLKGVEFLQ